MTAALRILVIDDEPALRQILGARLVRAGHAVESVGSGREALARLAQGDVDVALCDIGLPDASGIDVVRQARAAGSLAVFIMLTAFSSEEAAAEALHAGASDYLVKPVRADELALRLARIAELRRESGASGEHGPRAAP
jgi:two-component system response regulator AtoC